MAFLQQELGVAMSGAKGDVGGFKLWQATDPDVVLYTTKQPFLAQGANGRYQLAVAEYREQTQATVGDTTGDTYKITGGSALFTITTAPQFTPEQLAMTTEAWRAQLPALDSRFPQNPKFVPLNTQKGEAIALIDPEAGEEDPAFKRADMGTPGGTVSFLIDLKPLGAQEWIQGIRQKTNIPAGVQISYEYLRMMPPTGAVVTVHGSRVFQHLSGALKASYDGVFYGGSLDIQAAWEDMTRNGSVEITFIGQPPEGDAQFMNDLVRSFADQAREQLFKSLFVPKPDVKPAAAGDTGGIFGGANFALKWRKESESTDLSLTIKFEGLTWLKARMDADVTTLFKDVDESYVTEVNTEQSSVAALVVDGEEKAKTVACGWSASEGKAPESPVFDSEGGNKSFIVTSMHPGDVLTKGTARIVYDEPKWPVVVAKEEQPISEGPIVFKPSQYVGRHMIYMYVLDANDKIKLPIDEREHLIVNVAYTYMDTLTNPGKPPRKKTLRASARITAEGPMEFSYPFDPAAEEGKAMFSAFGVIGGKLVRAKAQPINFQEDSVFILAGPKGIQLVSDAFPETGRSVDEVARRLLSSRARPVVESSSPEVARELHREEVVRRAIRTEALRGGRAAETGRYLDEELATMLRSEAERTPARDLTEVSGKVMGVEYTPSGARLLVQDNGNVRPILLDRALADEALDQFDEPDKWVTVKLDDSGVARSILVRLGG